MKKGILLILLAAVFWGTLPMFSRFVYGYGIDPLTAGAWRAYIASATVLIWFLCKGTCRVLKLSEIPFYIAYGLAGVGGTFVFYMLAIERLPTAMAVMLLYTAPAFVIVFNRILYKEPITRIKLLALAATFGGCVLVVRAYDPATFASGIGGILIGLLSGISYSMVTVLGRKAATMHDSRTNTGLMLVCGTLVFLLLRPPWRLAAPTLPLLGMYFGLALLGSVFAYFCYLSGIARGVEGGVASLIATAEPVVATLLGVLVYGDVLEIWQVLGMVIVLSGVLLPLLPGRGAKRGDMDASTQPAKPEKAIDNPDGGSV